MRVLIQGFTLRKLNCYTNFRNNQGLYLWTKTCLSSNGTMDKGFDGNGGRIPRAHVNTAYQNDREEPTPMVTFNSNPAHTPGITLNDSSQTQVTHEAI